MWEPQTLATLRTSTAYTGKTLTFTPEEWRIAFLVPIFRKGNGDVCRNYGDTSLPKAYAKILTQREMP
jgi:hypothetical protein